MKCSRSRHCTTWVRLFDAYREAAKRARAGRPTMIYPVGLRSTEGSPVTLETFGELYGVTEELSAFAEGHKVTMGTVVWIPGSLMSYRDTGPMFEWLVLRERTGGGRRAPRRSYEGP